MYFNYVQDKKSVFLTVIFITLQYATNRAALRCKLHRVAAQRSVVCGYIFGPAVQRSVYY